MNYPKTLLVYCYRLCKIMTIIIPLYHISLRAAEGGQLKIVLFDETVVCLLAVCRDHLENKLSELPPR